MPDIQTLRIGAARVTILNAGDLILRLADEMAVPEAAWRPAHADIFDRRLPFPSQSVLIEHEGARVLVDVNDYRATVAPDSPYLPPNYTPPPDIPAQLASLGVAPGDVQHVVITHAHWDHFAGTTRRDTQSEDNGHVPTFPRARHYLGAADWENAELQAALRDPSSLEGRTLGVLRDRGLLVPIAAERAVAPDIAIHPAPGESPGHQIVRLRSEGQTLYVLGDLFHHAVEAERPDWNVTWADPAAMRATRHALTESALAENALLIAAHIPGVGRLERTATGSRWIAVSSI